MVLDQPVAAGSSYSAFSHCAPTASNEGLSEAARLASLPRDHRCAGSSVMLAVSEKPQDGRDTIKILARSTAKLALYWGNEYVNSTSLPDQGEEPHVQGTKTYSLSPHGHQAAWNQRICSSLVQ